MSYYWYTPVPPRRVKGGIRSKSKRGTLGQSWWAKRWINILENLNLGGRLDRGRSYARRGQVMSLEVQTGMVTAQVQGSERLPYDITMEINTLSRQDWKRLSSKIFSQPVLAAKLLAGQMPDNIEQVFKDAGMSLFPRKMRDINTDCTCPDWSNPCKHIAAVYYLLGEEFDRDPFLIFKMRGADREAILNMAGFHQMDAAASNRNSQGSLPYQTLDDSGREPLLPDPDKFWGHTTLQDGSPGSAHIPSTPAALPRQLGGFPFWRGEEYFMDEMEEAYRSASPAGLDAFLGERHKKDK